MTATAIEEMAEADRSESATTVGPLPRLRSVSWQSERILRASHAVSTELRQIADELHSSQSATNSHGSGTF